MHDKTDRNIQIHAAKAYASEFVDKNARWEVREENNNPQVNKTGTAVKQSKIIIKS